MVLALLLACAPEPADSAGPSPWTVTDPTVRPPVGPIDVLPDGEAVAGEPLAFDIRLPIAADGIAVQLAVGDAVGLGICPAPLSGDCLGVTGTPDLHGPGVTVGGVTRVEVPEVPATPSFAVQAVIVFPSRSYQSPPLAVPVRLVEAEVCDSGSDDDGDGLTDCADPDCSADAWCTDADGDGATPADGDCDDGDPFVSPWIDEICDDAVDNDCDGLVDIQRWYIDRDGDGHGTEESVVEICGFVGGFSLHGDDCDDDDAAISPSADEVCNGIDDDCDAAVDEPGVVDGLPAWNDADRDDFGNPDAPSTVCSHGPAWVGNDLDCDDTDDAVYPGAPDDPYDGIDADCAEDDDFDADGDGFASDAYDGTDCDDADPRVHPDSRWYLDLDADGWGEPDFYVDTCDPGAGWGLDQPDNCPGDANPDQADGDADGFGDVCDVCLAGDDLADGDGDGTPDACDPCPLVAFEDPLDADGDGVPDVCDEDDCDNGLDDDGDGLVDCLDPDCLSFCDADGDGFRGVHAGGEDCDDADPAVNPDGVEVCGGADEDCDGLVDDDDPSVHPASFIRYYADVDRDGWGDEAVFVDRCAAPPGTVPVPDDCDDRDPDVNPDAVEVCGGADEDCDGLVDDDDDSVDPAGFTDWYVDGDGDGVGDADRSRAACAPLPDEVDLGDDCDDTDPEVGSPDAWRFDGDGDGVGGGDPEAACEVPGPGWVLADLGDDCDDADPAFYPGAPEVCDDGVDLNCNGRLDGCTPGRFDGSEVDLDARDYEGRRLGEGGSWIPDVTGDGISELVISGPDGDGDWLGEAHGTIYVLSGADAVPDADLRPSDALFTIDGTPEATDIHWYVRGLADLNGDGLGELSFRAGLDDDWDPPPEFTVLVDGATIAGGGRHDASDVLWREVRDDELDAAWSPVAGDFDGDGAPDLAQPWWALVGDDGYGIWDAATIASGEPLTFDNTRFGLVRDHASANDIQAADVDGDGVDDLLIAGDNHRPNGGAYLVSGASMVDGLDVEVDADWILEASHGPQMGMAVEILGDADGDGLPDVALASNGVGGVVVMGAELTEPGTIDLGEVGVALTYPIADDYFGWDIADLGDSDGDALSDLAVSAPAYGDPCGFFEGGPCDVGGAVFVFGGHVLAGGGVIAAEDLDTIVVTDGGDGFWDPPFAGNVIAGPGDVDGDGLGDLWVTAPGASVGGRGYLYGSDSHF